MVNIDAQVDFDLARQVFGMRHVFQGNADPVRDPMNATPTRPGPRGRNVVRKARLPFMLSAGCEIPAATKDETMMAFSLAAITSGGGVEGARWGCAAGERVRESGRPAFAGWLMEDGRRAGPRSGICLGPVVSLVPGRKAAQPFPQGVEGLKP